MAITTWHPRYGRWPKHHLDKFCDGLEQVPYEARGELVVPSAMALLRYEDGRPCRRCSLEPALAEAAQGKYLWQGPRVHVTFSGQGVPGEPGSWQWKTPYEWDQVSESGAERLGRIAAMLALPVCATSAGPVASGTVSERWAKVLERNVRLYRTGDVPGCGTPALQAVAFWGLANAQADNPDGPMSAADAWQVAATIARA